MNKKVEKTEEKGKKHAKGNLPRKEADINTVAADVATSWEQRPSITLLWTDATQLKMAAATFGTSYTGRNDVKGARRSITKEFKDINAEIDKSAERVKGYVADLYSKKEASSHYESFGIVKKSDKYKLPADNDKRLYALNQMLKGIAKYNLADRKYGEIYWTSLRTRFADVKSRSAQSDKASSEHVSIKAGKKAMIKKTLNALVHIIKGNYPDTWKEELRVWGFQKEKY